jgi:hypothetical protein
LCFPLKSKDLPMHISAHNISFSICSGAIICIMCTHFSLILARLFDCIKLDYNLSCPACKVSGGLPIKACSSKTCIYFSKLPLATNLFVLAALPKYILCLS